MSPSTRGLVVALAILAATGCAKAIKSPLAQCSLPTSVVGNNSDSQDIVVYTNERICRDLDGRVVENLASGLQPHELYGVKCAFERSKSPQIRPGPTSIFTSSNWCESNGGEIDAYMSYPLQAFTRN